MIYLSHLLPDQEMGKLQEQYQLGIEAIEFSIGYCLDRLEEHITAYQKRLENLNYTALAIHGPFLDLNPASNDSLIREVTKFRFEQAYEAAKRLGADKIIYHSGFLPKVNYLEGWTDLMIPFWDTFLAKKDESVSIYLENVFDPCYEYLKEVVERVGHPAFSLCLDVGHANHASEQSARAWAEGLGTSIGHVHLHNNDGIHDSHQRIFEGSLPMAELLKSLQEHCPKADWTIENSDMISAKASLMYLEGEGFIL